MGLPKTVRFTLPLQDCMYVHITCSGLLDFDSYRLPGGTLSMEERCSRATVHGDGKQRRGAWNRKQSGAGRGVCESQSPSWIRHSIRNVLAGPNIIPQSPVDDGTCWMSSSVLGTKGLAFSIYLMSQISPSDPYAQNENLPFNIFNHRIISPGAMHPRFHTKPVLRLFPSPKRRCDQQTPWS